MFKSIIKAIYYCHLNGVCHRDLKPENFILVHNNNDYSIKLIDFGLSQTFEVGDHLDTKQNNGHSTCLMADTPRGRR